MLSAPSFFLVLGCKWDMCSPLHVGYCSCYVGISRYSATSFSYINLRELSTCMLAELHVVCRVFTCAVLCAHVLSCVHMCCLMFTCVCCASQHGKQLDIVMTAAQPCMSCGCGEYKLQVLHMLCMSREVWLTVRVAETASNTSSYVAETPFRQVVCVCVCITHVLTLQTHISAWVPVCCLCACLTSLHLSLLGNCLM